MRLASPIYESVPLVYAGIGGLAMLIAYLDPVGPRTHIAFAIGLIGEIAALTLFLRRQDYRARRREYSNAKLDLPR
jgi:hypothetical protein